MDESQYLKLAGETFRRVEDAFEDVDAEDIDWDRAGDVMTFSFRDGKRCVLNTQRPTRQLWLAANARAWHFRYDEAKQAWLDEKDEESDFFGVFSKLIKEASNIDLPFA
jgi:CyaY protein